MGLFLLVDKGSMGWMAVERFRITREERSIAPPTIVGQCANLYDLAADSINLVYEFAWPLVVHPGPDELTVSVAAAIATLSLIRHDRITAFRQQANKRVPLADQVLPAEDAVGCRCHREWQDNKEDNNNSHDAVSLLRELGF